MSPRPFGSPECALFDPDLVELALGSLSGKRRVAALAHLECCERCSAEVEDLSVAADQLLELAPASEPPVGFETRVAARLRATVAKSRPKPYRRPVQAMLAAAAALAVAFGVGVVVDRATSGAGSPSYSAAGALEAARLMSQGHQVGRVLVFAGNPTWIWVDVEGVAWPGTLRCEVTLAGGRPVVLGSFWLSGGRGAWSSHVSLPAGRLEEARVVDGQGRVLAVAKLL
jgi:hypothetical protein